MYTRAEFEEAFRLLASGLFPSDEESLALLFDRRSLDEIGGMLAELDSRTSKAIKLVVDF